MFERTGHGSSKIGEEDEEAAENGQRISEDSPCGFKDKKNHGDPEIEFVLGVHSSPVRDVLVHEVHVDRAGRRCRGEHPVEEAGTASRGCLPHRIEQEDQRQNKGKVKAPLLHGGQNAEKGGVELKDRQRYGEHRDKKLEIPREGALLAGRHFFLLVSGNSSIHHFLPEFPDIKRREDRRRYAVLPPQTRPYSLIRPAST